ncbi:MAG TPA: VWA domain-containing protein [Gemmataceae bacterium]|nr:VWA domain-containing protein [Gemmataceae bacterium]
MARRSFNPLKGLAQAWFPLALGVVLLLLLPGFLLFALNLLGREGSINGWLQDRYRVSYHIPVPWWAALVLLLIPLLIVLLYFLKLKRKPLHVPSTFLWRKSIEDLHVNALFQWLRNNLLLLLQLLTLLALIYALMNFQVHGATTTGEHYILMIDNSASMSATDVAPNRLAQAKAEAQKVIDAHSDQDVGMVLVFNSEATTWQSYTNDRAVLRRAIEQIPPTQRPTRLKDALELADGLANPRRSAENEASRPANEQPGKERTYVTPEGIPTQVHLFSDGRFPDVPDFTLGNLNLHFHSVGKAGPENVDNVGLVTFNASRDEKDPSKVQVLVGVRNYRAKPVPVRVQLEVRQGGELKDFQQQAARPLGQGPAAPEDAGAPALVPARTVVAAKDREPAQDRPGEGLAAFDLSGIDERTNFVLHASLVNEHDQFALDNDAWLILGVVRKARVLIVSESNPVLHAFFDNAPTQKVAAVTYLAPADLKDPTKYARPARDGQYDLVIFDRCAPATVDDMPVGNTLFIGDVPPPWKKASLPALKNPHVKGWLSKDPLLRYLAALYEIGVDEAFRFELDPAKDPRVPPRVPRLLESDKDAALLFALPRESFRDVVMAFPLVTDDGDWNTNWPLQPSFPLFLRNVLYTLGNVSDAATEPLVQPGQVKILRPDVAVPEVEVTDPAGHAEALRRGHRADFNFAKTEQVGVYGVTWAGGGQRLFAVNLLDPDESNVEPRPEIQVGGTKVTAGATTLQARETWKWVAVAALALLLLEWFVYNRRIFV